MIPKLHGVGLNVNIHHFDNTSIEKIINALKKLGMKWVRVEIDYFQYQEKEKFSYLKRFVAKCHEENIVVLGLFNQFVAGSIANVFFSHHYNKPVSQYLKEYIVFVERIVRQLKEDVFYWEIWNEQNSRRFWISHPSPKEYVLFLGMMNTIILKESPESKIIFGGVVGNDVTPLMPFPKSVAQYTNFISDSIACGADKYVDYYGFHPYTVDCYISFKSKEQILENVKERISETIRKYSKYHLIITEFGISPILQFRITEADIVYIYKQLSIFLKKYSIPLCLYTLSDLDSKLFSRFNPERGFGLLSHLLEEKTMFTHLKESFQEELLE